MTYLTDIDERQFVLLFFQSKSFRECTTASGAFCVHHLQHYFTLPLIWSLLDQSIDHTLQVFHEMMLNSVEEMPEVAPEQWTREAELLTSNNNNSNSLQDNPDRNPSLAENLAKLQLPIDAEGYPVSFQLSQESEILDFWNRYGLVIVRDIFGTDQGASLIRDVIEGIWTEPELLGTGKIKRDDPLTWGNNNWPVQMGLGDGGFLSHFSDMDFQWSWNTRQHPNLHKLFSVIWKREDLWVKFDRTGLMRPTKGIKLLDGTVVDRPEWKTKSNWLHWDQNPWRDPGFVGVQGLLALSDSDAKTGGFHCVPGFNQFFRDWAQQNQQYQNKSGVVNVPEGDVMRQFIQKMPLRAGSFLVWDSRLPHGNFPNDCDRPRIVQYIAFSPAVEEDQKEIERRLDAFFVRVYASERPYPTLTELGQKIVGMRSWKTGKKASYFNFDFSI